jgi:Fur family transcriptional regulator, ferric uptake regulator
MDERSEAYAARSRYSQVQESLEAFIKGLPRGTHLTAAEVYRQARSKGLKVSLSTVYRTLNNLSLVGQVNAFVGERGRRYEAADGERDHDHLICVKCGWTMEFEDKLIHGFGKTVAERKHYDYRHSRFDIYGICSSCGARGDRHRIDQAVGAIEKALELLEDVTEELELAMEQMQMRKFARGRELIEKALPGLKDACRHLESQTVDLESDS